MSAPRRVERCLKDRPDGELLVAVGNASAFGVAWSALRTANQRVGVSDQAVRFVLPAFEPPVGGAG